jgi:hypothetical protein
MILRVIGAAILQPKKIRKRCLMVGVAMAVIPEFSPLVCSALVVSNRLSRRLHWPAWTDNGCAAMVGLLCACVYDEVKVICKQSEKAEER